MKHYKTKIKELKALTGLNIKELAEKMGCRRESIYYALRTKGTKSELRKKLEDIISPEWKERRAEDTTLPVKVAGDIVLTCIRRSK